MLHISIDSLCNKNPKNAPPADFQILHHIINVRFFLTCRALQCVAYLQFYIITIKEGLLTYFFLVLNK